MLRVIEGWSITHPFPWKKQPHAERPTDLISIAPVARIGDGEIDRGLAVVHLAGGTAPLATDTDALVTLFRNAHAVKDKRRGGSGSRLWRVRAKVLFDGLVFPRTLANKPLQFLLFDIDHACDTCY